MIRDGLGVDPKMSIELHPRVAAAASPGGGDCESKVLRVESYSQAVDIRGRDTHSLHTLYTPCGLYGTSCKF